MKVDNEVSQANWLDVLESRARIEPDRVALNEFTHRGDCADQAGVVVVCSSIGNTMGNGKICLKQITFV